MSEVSGQRQVAGPGGFLAEAAGAQVQGLQGALVARGEGGIAHQQQDALQWLMRQLVPQPSGYHLYGLDHVFGQAIANGEPLVIRHPALYDPGGSLQPLQNLLVIPCFLSL